jgi:preprotein translocase subunit SecF
MLKNNKIYNFMGIRKITFAFSLALLLVALVSFVMDGIRFGLDFTGGTLIEVGYSEPADLQQIRNALASSGFKGAIVQNFGSEKDIMIRMQGEGSNQLGTEVLAALQSGGDKVELRRSEFVGPQVGEQLKSQGLLALVLALLVVMVYLAFRFQVKFAIAAVLALIHDVIITLGFFAFFGWEFDLTVLAALLAVIGYSLNDTIVVFDRIRENMVNMRKVEVIDIINASVSQTLSRTIMTSLTTLITLYALFFTGGEMLRGFSIALIIGITIGTYSSIYIAATFLPLMKLTREDLLPPELEKEEFETP